MGSQSVNAITSCFGDTDYHYDGYEDPLGNVHLPTGNKYGKWPMKTKYWWAPHNKRRRYQIYAESSFVRWYYTTFLFTYK